MSATLLLSNKFVSVASLSHNFVSFTDVTSYTVSSPSLFLNDNIIPASVVLGLKPNRHLTIYVCRVASCSRLFVSAAG
jgi:hypothetical protein